MSTTTPKTDRSAQWVADIQFILDEVVRFLHKHPREYEDKRDFFADLPHPVHRGAKIICGHEADRRLWNMAEDYLTSHKMAGRIELAMVVENLSYQISSRFLKKGSTVNKGSVQAALDGAVKRAALKSKDITHFIPCTVVSDDDDPRAFSIGPVTFRRREDFLEQQAPAFERYIESFIEVRPTASVDEAKDEGRSFVADATAYFDHFGWVAAITIENCAPKISKDLARQSMQAALDVLRLMLGEEYADHLNMEGPPLSVVKTAELAMVGDKLDISLGRSLPGRTLGAGRWPKIVERFTEERLAGAGRTIEMLVKMERDKPLCQRLLDAITWFGQAVTEQQPAAKIVKFVNGIERVTQCIKSDKKVTETVCERAAALAFDYYSGDREHWLGRMKDLYEVRSCLVHGSMSPFDPDAARATREAEELATRILCRAIDYFIHLGLDAAIWSPERLDEQFQRLTAWAAEAPTMP
jgi:hypothetical protein